MDFFQAQALAHRRTKWLVILFVISVGATIVVTYLATILLIGQLPKTTPRHRHRNYDDDNQATAQVAASWWDPQIFALVAGGTVLLVAGAALFKTAQLRQGGPAIAEMVGGRRI